MVPPEAPVTTAVPPPPERPGARYTWFVLLAAVVLYILVAIELSFLRYRALDIGTWDLGLYQQALWSGAHGGPFYESADFEAGNFASFFQVHTSYVLYGIVPIYATYPTAYALFVIQSVLVGLAAVPLYVFARDRSGAPWLALVAPVLYLVWAPTLSSNLYDFHVEAFLPLEFFAFIMLWNRRYFDAGAVVATLAFLTLEVMPVLLFFAGLYFIAEAWPFAPPGPSGSDAWLSRSERLGRQLRAAIRSRMVVASIALMAASVVAFELLVLSQQHWVGTAWGLPPFPSVIPGFVVGGVPSTAALAVGNVSTGFGGKLLYWVLALALLGFLPLLAPRALLLAVPWFAFTFLTADPNFTVLGYQYGFLVACALFIGFAAALPRAERILLFLAGDQRPEGRWPIDLEPPALGLRRRRTAYRYAAVAFAALVAVNLMMGPVSPWVQDQTPFGAGYRLSYDPGPGLADAQTLAALISSNATVLATDGLFPLIANDLQAYTVGGGTQFSENLPFSPSTLPTYVFVAGNQSYELPDWLPPLLYNATHFGLRGIAWSTPLGPALLFRMGYIGLPLELGSAPTLPFNASGASLRPQPLGQLVPSGNEEFPQVVESLPGAAGPFLYGPSTGLPAGNISITIFARASLPFGGPYPHPDTRVLSFGASGFGLVSVANGFANFSSLNVSGWAAITLVQNLSGPTVQFGLILSTLTHDVAITVERIEFALAPSVPAPGPRAP